MQLRLKELRQRRGMTLAQVGKAVDREPSTIHYYEQARINLSLGMLERLAKALNCTVLDLLTEDAPEVPHA